MIRIGIGSNVSYVVEHVHGDLFEARREVSGGSRCTLLLGTRAECAEVATNEARWESTVRESGQHGYYHSHLPGE